MIRKVWEFITSAVTVIFTVVAGIAMLVWILFFNISCYWNTLSAPISWVSSWFEESAEDIEQFNKQNPALYKYNFGETVVTLASPNGYERVIGDTYRIREFKGGHARQGFENITYYLRTQDITRFSDDMDFEPEYVMIVKKSESELFDKEISNEFLEDFYQQFLKIPEDDLKTMILEGVDFMLHKLGFTRDDLKDVQIDVRREMGNEAMFYMTGIIKIYMEDGQVFPSSTTNAFLNAHGGLVVLSCTTPLDDNGATAESLINSWADKIYNLNK